MNETEIIHVRVQKENWTALVSLSEETKLSISEIMRLALNDYLHRLRIDKKVKKELRDKIKFLEQLNKASEARKKSQLILKKYTILLNQKRRLALLQRDGLSEQQLKEIKKAFKEEAKALNIYSVSEKMRRKPLKIVKVKKE